MRKHTDVMLLYRIARHYYIDKLSQNEISARENISRSQISRLLDKAAELGIVKVQVEIPERLSPKELEMALQQQLGLAEVVIALVPEDSDEGDEPAEAVATVAADYLPRALKNCGAVGLGWGRTLYSLSLKLSYRDVDSRRVYVPLVGLSGTENPYLQINNIVDRVAEKHRARGHFVTALAIREKGAYFSRLDVERAGKLHDYWKKLDAAVIGLGAKPGSKGMLMITEVSDDYVEKIQGSQAKGDILSQFFYEDGSLVDLGDDYNLLMFDIRELRKVKKVICLAGGKDKAEGIIAAARAGYMNILVTDSNTAKAIFEILRGREGDI